MTYKYFGTDGILAAAPMCAITPDLALRVGQAAGLICPQARRSSSIGLLTGKDTRLLGLHDRDRAGRGLHLRWAWTSCCLPGLSRRRRSGC